MLLLSAESLKGKIGIFGGSFDPVHNAHIEAANLAKNLLDLQAVIFIPTSQNPLKINSPVCSGEDRIAMLELALRGQDNMYVSSIEANSSEPVNYTIDTLKALDSGPKKQFYLLLGSDQIMNLHLWKDYKELFSLAKIVILGRASVRPATFADINPNLDSQEIAQLSAGFIEYDRPVSSTEVRNILSKGLYSQAAKFLPAEVLEFIQSRKLYC